MDQDAKVWKLARLLVGKHGRSAAEVAHARAQDSLDHQDYDNASLWSRTAKIARHMASTGRTRRDNPEPPLAELIDDPVTQAVMAGDHVSRAELEQTLTEAKRKLEEK